MQLQWLGAEPLQSAAPRAADEEDLQLKKKKPIAVQLFQLKCFVGQLRKQQMEAKKEPLTPSVPHIEGYSDGCCRTTWGIRVRNNTRTAVNIKPRSFENAAEGCAQKQSEIFRLHRWTDRLSDWRRRRRRGGGSYFRIIAELLISVFFFPLSCKSAFLVIT